MNSVEITVEGMEEPEWIDRAGRFCRTILNKLSLDNWEVSIVFCSNDFIRELNHRFRGKDEPTDVLTFSQSEGEGDFPFFGAGPHAVGDIVISLEMLEQTQTSFRVDPEEELRRLLIHGILHLSGYDHEDNSPDREMLRLQEEILKEVSEEKLF